MLHDISGYLLLVLLLLWLLAVVTKRIADRQAVSSPLTEFVQTYFPTSTSELQVDTSLQLAEYDLTAQKFYYNPNSKDYEKSSARLELITLFLDYQSDLQGQYAFWRSGDHQYFSAKGLKLASYFLIPLFSFGALVFSQLPLYFYCATGLLALSSFMLRVQLHHFWAGRLLLYQRGTGQASFAQQLGLLHPLLTNLLIVCAVLFSTSSGMN